MTAIRFGTDGWRGIIGDDFTRENVGRVARAYAVTLHADGVNGRGVVVGYDRRFLSDRMGRHAAEELAAAGVPVKLADGPVTTPAVSVAVTAGGHAGGLVVTASHNPPEYNGVKLKSAAGGSASEEFVARVAANVGRVPASAPRAGLCLADIDGDYTAHILSLRHDRPPARPLRIVVDTMHGSASGAAGRILRAMGHEIIEIRDSANPSFGGVSPEPIPPHVAALERAVLRETADLGVALDGDGDRIGAVTADGAFFSPHRILSLMALTSLRSGEQGRIVKTVSTTGMLDRIGETFGATVTTTAIGFKHIVREIEAGDVLVGGEESGGLWAPGYIPERDGIRIAILLANAVAGFDRPLHEEWRAITREFGTWEYARRDIAAPFDARDRIEESALAVSAIGGARVARVDSTDGVKLVREDGYWLMLRFSGTEPVLRLYAEGSSTAMCGELLDEAEALVGRVTT